MLTPWALIDAKKSIYATRGGDARRPDKGGSWLTNQIRACWLLGEVERKLQQLSMQGTDVSAYESFLPSWWNAVVLPNEGWNTTQSSNTQQQKRVITQDSLATLAACAAFLDVVSTNTTYRTSSESLGRARDALDEITDLLSGPEVSLSGEGRAYVYQLITEIRSMFDASAGSIEFDLVRRIHELQGFLATIASDLESAEPGNKVAERIRAVVRVVRPIILPAAGIAGYALGMTADVLAITQAVGDQ